MSPEKRRIEGEKLLQEVKEVLAQKRMIEGRAEPVEITDVRKIQRLGFETSSRRQTTGLKGVALALEGA